MRGQHRITSIISAEIVIVVLYAVLLFSLFSVYGVPVKFQHFKLWSILLSTLFVIYFSSTLVQYVRLKKKEPTPFWPFAARKLVRFTLDWLPLVTLVTIYENLREYTGIIRPDAIDAVLYKMDLMLFGVEPTVWIQKFTHPFFTDYFAFTYGLYLILPLSLGWLFYLLNKRREFHALSSAVILCLCMGFLLYLVFPAGPPRFYLADLYVPRQLESFFGYYTAMQKRFDEINPMMYRASFPSLHVALSSLALVYAVKFKSQLPFRKFIVGAYAVLVVSLWIATVYLRHHWVVDIFAGWVVALVSVVAAEFVQRRFSRQMI